MSAHPLNQVSVSDLKVRVQGLPRQLTLASSIALNMIDMIGAGPFITLPLMVATMGGPLALCGWIAGAFIVMADGLIWAELGAAMPRAGGTYEYLQELYGRRGFGRLLSFLFVFQLIFSAPISIATGCVGLGGYLSFVAPWLRNIIWHYTLRFHFFGSVSLTVEVSGATLAAMAAAWLATLLVYRKICGVGTISRILWFGVIATLGFVIVAGLTHFHRSMAFPSGWSHPVSGTWSGFPGALLIALYDYWGYYNICFLGEEVRQPQRNIPRSMLISIAFVAGIYLLLNISILGVLPVRDMLAMNKSAAQNFAAAKAVEIAFGSVAGSVVSLLVVWTAFASVFSLLAGYSRIPYAAARDGNFPPFFAKLHHTKSFPCNSVLILGAIGSVFCVLQLRDLLAALVVIRILLLFLMQAVGIVVWRIRDPQRPRPFRMWLFPLPVIISVAGFAVVLSDKRQLLARGLIFVLAGTGIYFVTNLFKRTSSNAIRGSVPAPMPGPSPSCPSQWR
jgi:APA family basic amino acid/polyamine antiporter